MPASCHCLHPGAQRRHLHSAGYHTHTPSHHLRCFFRAMRLLCTQLRPGACCLTVLRSSRFQRLSLVAISQISFVQYCPRGSQKCRDVSARGLEPGAICVDHWRARAQSKTMDTGGLPAVARVSSPWRLSLCSSSRRREAAIILQWCR